MDFGLKINTQSLQDRFPDVYRQFFNENDLVISTPFSIPLFPGMYWKIGGPDVSQKLPFKVFMGIKESVNHKGVQLGNILAYLDDKEQFSAVDIESINWAKFIPHLNQLLDQISNKKNTSGIIVNILLEKLDDIGFNISFSTFVPLALRLYFDDSLIDFLKEATSISGDELQKRETANASRLRALMDEILKSAVAVLTHSVSGRTMFNAFIDSEYPIVHFTEERGGTTEKLYKNLFPLEIINDPSLISKLHWWGFRLNELEDGLEASFPLDVVSISTGRRRDYVSAMRHIHKILFPGFDDLQQYIRNLFSKVIIRDASHIPPFLKDIEEEGAYLHNYLIGKIYNCLYVLKCFIEVFQNRQSTQAIHAFLESFGALSSADVPFEEAPSYHLQLIMDQLRQQASTKQIPVALLPLSWGKQDANVLVFSQSKKFRDEIFEIVKKMKRAQNVYIDFASWRDGWGKDGLRIEQFASKGIYSKFASPDSLQLTVWNKGSVKSSIIERKDVNPKGFDLFFDQAYEKIFVAGKAITSKEIPTQKATIEVVSALLSSEGHRLRNKMLPESSYAKYRNELQGKIVGPLVDIVKKRLKKDLKLKIEGTLTDFEILFDPKGLNVALLK